MKGKIFMLILNAMYLIATIVWFFVDQSQSFEPIVAIVGGLVSLASFYVANGNSLSVKIGRQINCETYNENNNK
jgi:hypothetical protein